MIGGSSSIESIDYMPCNKEPCNAKRDTTVDLLFEGTAPADATSLQISAQFDAGGWIPLLMESICDSATSCPVTKGQKLEVNYQFLVDTGMPTGINSMRWKIIGDSGSVELACVEFQVFVP